MFQWANLRKALLFLAFSPSEPMPLRALSCICINLGVDELETRAHLLEAPGGEHNCHLLKRYHDTNFSSGIIFGNDLPCKIPASGFVWPWMLLEMMTNLRLFNVSANKSLKNVGFL